MIYIFKEDIFNMHALNRVIICLHNFKVNTIVQLVKKNQSNNYKTLQYMDDRIMIDFSNSSWMIYHANCTLCMRYFHSIGASHKLLEVALREKPPHTTAFRKLVNSVIVQSSLFWEIFISLEWRFLIR